MIRTTDDERSAANDVPVKRQSSVFDSRTLLDPVGMGGFESRGGPVYRSVLPQPQAQYRDFSMQGGFIGKAQDLSMGLPGFSLGKGPEAPTRFSLGKGPEAPTFYDAKPLGLGLADFQTDLGLKALGLEQNYSRDYQAPPFSTRPQPPLLEARVFDVEGKYGAHILPRIQKLYKEEEVFDEKIDEEAARMEGGWYSERHYEEITFTIRVYEKNMELQLVEIVRRSGCGFAFADFMETAKKALSQGSIAPLQLPRFSGELPGIGDVDIIDITPKLVSEWIQILGDKNIASQVREHEAAVIAKAADQDDGLKMTQGTDGIAFVKTLIDTLGSCEEASTGRHARKAIQRLQNKGLKLSADDQARVERKIRQLDRRN